MTHPCPLSDTSLSFMGHFLIEDKFINFTTPKCFHERYVSDVIQSKSIVWVNESFKITINYNCQFLYHSVTSELKEK